MSAGSGQIRRWRSIGVDGSLPLDSFRARRMRLTACCIGELAIYCDSCMNRDIGLAERLRQRG